MPEKCEEEWTKSSLTKEYESQINPSSRQQARETEGRRQLIFIVKLASHFSRQSMLNYCTRERQQSSLVRTNSRAFLFTYTNDDDKSMFSLCDLLVESGCELLRIFGSSSFIPHRQATELTRIPFSIKSRYVLLLKRKTFLHAPFIHYILKMSRRR